MAGMIVINAGAHKSGSTWVHNILVQGLPKRPAEEVMDNGEPGDLPDAISNLRATEEDKEKLHKCLQALPGHDIYLVKIHMCSDRLDILPLLKRASNLRFVVISRDPRDVIVSSYYHDLTSRFSGAFKEYLGARGEQVLRHAMRYRRFWERLHKAIPGQVLLLTYEALHEDFDGAVDGLFSFLGYPEFDREKVAKLKDINLNRKYFTKQWMRRFHDAGLDFYRKGIVGDYLNHFDEEDLRRFRQWANEFSKELERP